MFPNHPLCYLPMGKISLLNHSLAVLSCSCLTLNHSNGSKLDGLLADASIMACVHHIRYIFVGFWGLRSTEIHFTYIYKTTQLHVTGYVEMTSCIYLDTELSIVVQSVLV